MEPRKQSKQWFGGCCSAKWTTDVTKVRHFAKDEWETSDSTRLFIEMQNETE